MKHIATLYIILLFSHCTISLRCYECADKEESALNCFPALVRDKLLNIPKYHLGNLASCEKQSSVLCKGHCLNFTISGCGNNDFRRYSEFKSEFSYDIISGVRSCEPMVKLNSGSSCVLKSTDGVGISN